MYCLSKKIDLTKKSALIGFDVEWTKNYRIKNGNQPFCFSFVSLDLDSIKTKINDKIIFGVEARYVDNKQEIPELIHEADAIMGTIMQRNGHTLLVGHQLSSDLGVLLGHPLSKLISNISDIKYLWHNRRSPTFIGPNKLNIFDTRYDLKGVLGQKSRRLVDVCEELHLNVSQPEINGSMTKMQNKYYETGDRAILERLLVLNIRHSLSSALLYVVGSLVRKNGSNLNVNQLLHSNLFSSLSYIQSNDFQFLLQ